MEKICIQGVVTHALAFKEHDRIITVFTPENGLLKLFVKGAFNQQNAQGSTSAPLTLIEAICTQGRSELYTCREIASLNSHFGLRQSLPMLEAACDMLHVITTTQMPGKAAPELYQLFTTFLAKLPTAANPLTVSVSFRLKTLRYEGLLELSKDVDYRISSTDRLLLEVLTYSRDFTQIADLTVDATLAETIKNRFQFNISH